MELERYVMLAMLVLLLFSLTTVTIALTALYITLSEAGLSVHRVRFMANASWKLSFVVCSTYWILHFLFKFWL